MRTMPLFVATGRFVLALNPGTGEEIWRTKLPAAMSSGYVVTLLLKGDRLFAGRGGRVYCLDARSGEIQWENSLPKTGTGAVLMVMEGSHSSSDGAATSATVAAQAASHAAAH